MRTESMTNAIKDEIKTVKAGSLQDKPHELFSIKELN
jgi:hypothetical protein